MRQESLGFVLYLHRRAGVVELVDTPDLGSGGESRGGSSPFTRTKLTPSLFFYI